MTNKNKDLHGYSIRKQTLTTLKTNAALFQPRKLGLDDDQIQALMRALRRGSSLEALDCWCDPDGVLWLIHGHHRLAALTKLGRKKHDVRVHSGTLAQARLVSIAANSQDRLPLSTSERAQFAWQLHCDHGKAYSITTLAKSAGISQKTVVNMRKVHGLLSEEGVAIPERWIDARKAASEGGREFPDHLRDVIAAEQRKWLTERIAGPINHVAKDDPSMAFDAVVKSFGRDAFRRAAAQHGFYSCSDEFEDMAGELELVADTPDRTGDEKPFGAD